ncbi:beta-N-acetylhexosaminidase [Allosphingosinicella flava]|uniref:beta-N-acetylhexosaminidase n=1 Tax=Allosphingosinicella flava TaxID=2771430 RepID=A0A7T2GHL6_9SPHN|nr:beta-N-acetylhexosaminidase [Sphingosinicella flava]QPQ54045.1 beta-N-acetylhexosaminidase [Sphingosinicella flava]
MLASIFGMARESLSADERAFFKDTDPAGYILFARNCAGPDQMRALTDDLRAIHGRDDVPILIDQEGGRVARMKPPVWPAFPPGEAFARLYAAAPISAMEALRVNCAAIAALLRDVGVNVDCLPLLDVRQPGAHDIIGDRALGSEPMQVASLGRATLDGLREGGVVGVVKHMPGHGRSMSDSHVELPVVSASEEELETDIRPFRSLREAPMGMTAHVVYTAWDKDNCGSQSPYVIGEIIRKRIGFEGWLMSDDLGMHALQGDFGVRAAKVLAAGCDVALHCSGDMAEMQAIASAIGTLTPDSAARLERAMATVKDAAPVASYAELAAKRDALLAYA